MLFVEEKKIWKSSYLWEIDISHVDIEKRFLLDENDDDDNDDNNNDNNNDDNDDDNNVDKVSSG